jgi:hypothetical protein
MKKFSSIVLFSALCSPAFADVVAVSNFKGSDIVVRTCDHDAAAICSLTWNGVRFINDYDHGRQLQSASSFASSLQELQQRLYGSEAFNPTEAGSYLDGFNPSPSSSVKRWETSVSNVIFTQTQMAFWRPVNGQKLSSHLLNKTVGVGSPMPNVLNYQVTFSIPSNETHGFGQFEVLTGYMPTIFTNFYKLENGIAVPLSDGPGEQNKPVILATASGSHAMGIYSTHAPQAEYPDAGYGRWRFNDVVKWNTVHRINNPRGNYTFQVYVAVGTLADVTASIKSLSGQ